MARIRRRSPSYGSRRSAVNIAAGIGTFALACAVAVTVYAYPEILGIGQPDRDKTGCLLSPPAQITFAVDGSSRFSTKQKGKSFRDQVLVKMAELPPEGRLDVVLVTEETAIRLKAFFRACSPAAAEPGSLVGSTERYRKNQIGKAQARLEKKMDSFPWPEDAATGSQLPASEGLKAVVGYHEKASADAGYNEFIYYSDLRSRPAEDSHYGDLDLSDDEVQIMVADSVEISQSEKQADRDRWAGVFHQMGARLLHASWRVIPSGRPLPRDRDECLINPPALARLVVDVTDSYDDHQWNHIRQTVFKAANRLGKDAVIEIYAIEDVKISATPLPRVRICHSEILDAGTLNQEDFARSVQASFDEAFWPSANGESTPLYEFLGALHQGRPVNTQESDYSLLVFSDMLSNSPALGFWENGREDLPSEKLIAQKPALARSLSDLSGAQVEVHYMSRAKMGFGKMQTKHHIGQFSDLLDAQGVAKRDLKIFPVDEG
ncbi:MAG: hypothetical protein AAF530_23910 [Pseudomonadota bacterium]